MIKLRPYQQQAVDATLSHFRKTNEPAVIVLPTGAGKSLVIAELARLAKRKILVLTHVKELVEQNFTKFNQYAVQNQTKAGVYSAGLKLKQTEQQVTFASVQSVVRNVEQFAAEYSLVIIDECHRVSDFEQDNQYGKIIQQLLQHNAQLKILGLTATPYRMGIGWIYQYHYHGIKRSDETRPFKKCIYELPLSFMLKHQFLTPPEFIDAPVAQYDFSALNSNASGAYVEQEVNQLLVKYPRVTQAIIEQVEDFAKDRKGVMIFAATIKHAEEIKGYLPEHSTALVTGKTPMFERESIIAQFKAEKTKFLINVAVLTTGFDAPHVDFIAILRPTQSVSLYQQIVGRGLRLAPDKKDCLVIDYAGNGINIYYPEIGNKKPNSDSEPVQVFCPACGFANSFWGKTDGEGKITEHYGRKCQGFFEHEDSLEIEECDYRFRFKECPDCNGQNDIAARVCSHCEKTLVDPDEQLKSALKLKNALVLRCSGMLMEHSKGKLKLTYHDEDGAEVSEWFDFNNNKQVAIFNREFGRRFKAGVEPTEFKTIDHVLNSQYEFSAPDFVVARKAKNFWQIKEKIFDYQGAYRKAHQLS